MLWHKTIGAGGLVGGGGSDPITFTGHNTNSSAARSSYTWTSFDLGPATSNKYVVVLVVWVSSFSRSLNSMTIAGVSATVGSIRSGSFSIGLAYGFAPVTATTGDIVCNWSGNTASGYSQTIDVWQWAEDSSFTLSEGYTANSSNEASPALNTVAGDGVFLINVNNWSSYDNADVVTDNVTTPVFASGHVSPLDTVTATPSTYADFTSTGSDTSARHGALALTPS